jgi:hypothetical protein
VNRTSYLTPKAELRSAGGKGFGIFATAAIARDEPVVGFGGRVVERREFDQLDTHERTHGIQIDDDLFLVSPPELDPADYTNHSCEPNAGLRGNVVVVAMRDIEAGEEICIDYAMCDTYDYDEFVCECRTPSCRGLVTGGDWQRPELQALYAGYFSTYLHLRIGIETNLQANQPMPPGAPTPRI